MKTYTIPIPDGIKCSECRAVLSDVQELNAVMLDGGAKMRVKAYIACSDCGHVTLFGGLVAAEVVKS